jgi:hypothetical protein
MRAAVEDVDVEPPVEDAGGVEDVEEDWRVTVTAIETPPDVAVMTALPPVEMVPALAVNLAVTLLQDTVTDAGTVSAVLFDESAMAAPPVGAPLLNLAVQVADAPEASVVGVHCREPSAGPVGAGVETGGAGVEPGGAAAVSEIEVVLEALL